jgi:hypothetical protein
VAEESVPVTIVLPEMIVEFDTAACPLTVTWPVTEISAVEPVGAAKVTIEYTVQTATSVISVVSLRKLLLPSI